MARVDFVLKKLSQKIVAIYRIGEIYYKVRLNALSVWTRISFAKPRNVVFSSCNDVAGINSFVHEKRTHVLANKRTP